MALSISQKSLNERDEVEDLIEEQISRGLTMDQINIDYGKIT